MNLSLLCIESSSAYAFQLALCFPASTVHTVGQNPVRLRRLVYFILKRFSSCTLCFQIEEARSPLHRAVIRENMAEK